jgi:hypothetical protein
MKGDNNSGDTVGLSKEIYDNVREDRSRIKNLIDSLRSVTKDDDLAGLASVEYIAKLQECMIKSNSQLIELLKTNSKSDPEKDHGLKNSDRENIFDVIDQASGN